MTGQEVQLGPLLLRVYAANARHVMVRVFDCGTAGHPALGGSLVLDHHTWQLMWDREHLGPAVTG